MKKLYVNSIESFSTKDGEGIRSVIFLQGCHLNCVYCHNIETRPFKKGELVETKELVRRVLRFAHYFGEKGGVTISGGEPLMQIDGLIDLCKELKANNINIAIDTAGIEPTEKTEEVIKLADKIILDLKFGSEEDYKKYTGGSLKTTLNFLRQINQQKKRVWIRIVVVPNINDTQSAMDRYISVLKDYDIEQVELLPFHTLGFDKYEKLQITNPLIETKAMDISKLTILQNYLDKGLILR